MVETQSPSEELVKLSLDFRVALAHSPINPRDIHQVKAGWLREGSDYAMGDDFIRYGFILNYRSRWVYLWGSRFPKRQRADHGLQYFDVEPTWLYTMPKGWNFEVGDIINGPHYLTDEEADRPSGRGDNASSD